MIPEKYECDGQMNIFDYFRENEKKLLKRNCGATLEPCEIECNKNCCQRCTDFSCGERCGYSKRQPSVFDCGKWVENKSFEI